MEPCVTDTTTVQYKPVQTLDALPSHAGETTGRQDAPPCDTACSA